MKYLMIVAILLVGCSTTSRWRATENSPFNSRLVTSVFGWSIDLPNKWESVQQLVSEFKSADGGELYISTDISVVDFNVGVEATLRLLTSNGAIVVKPVYSIRDGHKVASSMVGAPNKTCLLEFIENTGCVHTVFLCNKADKLSIEDTKVASSLNITKACELK